MDIGNGDKVVVKYIRGNDAVVINGVLQPRPKGFEEVTTWNEAKKMIASGTVQLVCLAKDMEAF